MKRPAALTLPTGTADWFLEPVPIMEWVRAGFAYDHEIRPEETVTIPAQALARLLDIARMAHEWYEEADADGRWDDGDTMTTSEAFLLESLGGTRLKSPQSGGEGRG